ncbi:sulfite exporter TauE/SafE family protein [Glycomyces paridis]|uniref:Probable membrane transporter protein n=1 Tax=Glycomyces paridis TaxID=2126555 RepID=A0A4S8P8Z7_9ACTN|nr:sulfite exporter TauE/SafE family protein [Glycomyces paridis]THV26697.1 sulfite exporter TauE/SafE family protein [Glycomyces paridis]
MQWTDLIGLLAALLISVVTAPAGVSGAVFLLPVQLSVLHVPNPAVTPTNLLFNVIAGPGALLRYRRRRPLRSPLATVMILGTCPGVVAGALARVYLVADPDVFRLCAAMILGPLGVWLLLPRRERAAPARDLRRRTVLLLALGAGFVGGVYGIGGGSLLGPILVGAGMSVVLVAPATLLSTFVTSLVGCLTYAALSLTAPGSVAPDWSLGIACGIGGLVGGHLGAAIQPRLPERLLRALLGALAAGLACLYLAQGLS